MTENQLEIREYVIEIKSPVVIVHKRGSGNFLISSDFIPSSTLLGAFARTLVLYNISQKLGNCQNITDLDVLPDCINCSQKDTCLYPKVWHTAYQGGDKIFSSWGYPVPSDAKKNFTLGSVIPSLRTIVETRKLMDNGTKLIGDALLHLGKIAFGLREGDLNPLLKQLKIRNNPVKRSPRTILFYDGNFESLFVKKRIFSHTAISLLFNSTYHGQLYHYEAIAEEQLYHFVLIAKRNTLDALEELLNLKEGHELFIGAAKNRGYGRVIVKKVKNGNNVSFSKYIEHRKQDICKGLTAIKDILNDEKHYYFTITGLSPIKIHNTVDATIRDLLNPLNNVMDINRVEYHAEFTTDTFVRFERSSHVGSLTLTPVIKEGFAILVRVPKSEIDFKALGEALAKLELSHNNVESWFNWIFINHPVHYEKSTLR